MTLEDEPLPRTGLCLYDAKNDGFVRIVGEDDILCFVLDDLVFCTFELADNDAILVNDGLAGRFTLLHVQDGVAALQGIVRVGDNVNLVAADGQMAPVGLVCRDLELGGSGFHLDISFSANGFEGDVGAGRYGNQLRNDNIDGLLPAGVKDQDSGQCQYDGYNLFHIVHYLVFLNVAR